MCTDKMLVDAYMKNYGRSEKSKKRKYYYQIAKNIGDNAVRLVNDFFLFGIIDDVINYKSNKPFVDSKDFMWTLNDLDRALDEMRLVE